MLDEAPAWLEEALSSADARLAGHHIAFNWEDHGWCVGRLACTPQVKSNYSAIYLNAWREEHTLLLSALGRGGHGSWVLLEPSRPTAPPIAEYKAGKYKVGDAWHRAEHLPQYTGVELATARELAKVSQQQASQLEADAELDAPYTAGETVEVKHRDQWFRAVVLEIRSHYPPIKIRFLDADAPAPRTALMRATHVRAA